MTFGNRVFTQVDRPSAELVARLAEIPTPDLADSMKRAGVVSGGIQAIYRPMRRVAGSAVTINLLDGSFFNMLKIGMEMTRPGDMLVIAGRANINYALLGGNVCKGLKHRGVVGCVVDGAVRDVAQIRDLDFPVHARGLAINAGPTVGPGEVNVPVAFGHCVVFPGDIVVADEEGIVVVPPRYAEEILERVAKLQAMFDSIQPALERGEVTNIASIRQTLVESGCAFIDAPYSLEANHNGQAAKESMIE